MSDEVKDRLEALEAEMSKLRDRSSSCSCEYAKAAYHLFHAAISDCWNLGERCCKDK